MLQSSLAFRMLDQEAHAMLTRLDKFKPFVLHMPMVPAAAVPQTALVAIENYLAKGRHKLRKMVQEFIRWLHKQDSRNITPDKVQRKFTYLRLKFNASITQFDIFADVLTQRSEHEYGTWVAGLDAVAADALKLPGDFYQVPPVITYLDRGHGAAIRRARTRLPGSGKNPVAIIRIPRERMIGSSIASSLVHEVGHQGAALLGLINSLKPVLRGLQSGGEKDRIGWRCWERWISEILADFWSVAKVGVASTLGLIGVVSLPRAFVFRIALDDPHPIPWIRVKLSCAMGHMLYPHSQWHTLANVWESYYPRAGLDKNTLELLSTLENTMPAFITLMVNHRPKALYGKSLMEVLSDSKRQPAQLANYYKSWRSSPDKMRTALPSLVFAVLGQAKADGRINSYEESRVLAELLSHWALSASLESSARNARNFEYSRMHST